LDEAGFDSQPAFSPIDPQNPKTMNTLKTVTKVKEDATYLGDAAAFKNASVWVLLRNGQQCGKILWTLASGYTGNSWKCAIILYSSAYEALGFAKDQPDGFMGGKVIGKTGPGGGYDMRTASFEDCLRRNGYDGPMPGGYGADSFLRERGFDVIQAI
jgi:hypothetical protein